MLPSTEFFKKIRWVLKMLNLKKVRWVLKSFAEFFKQVFDFMNR
jgi:hypothetical protein